MARRKRRSYKTSRRRNYRSSGYRRRKNYDKITILGLPVGTVLLTVVGWFVLNKKSV